MTLHPAIIFHFADPDDWQAAQHAGVYSPRSWKTEGYIHCATSEQIAGVIERHLKGRGTFIKLSLSAEALAPDLRYEWSTASGDRYPHLYGEIPLSSIFASEEIVL